MSSGIETEKVEEEDILVLAESVVERRVFGSSAEQDLDLIENPGVQLRRIYYPSANDCGRSTRIYRPLVKSSNSSP